LAALASATLSLHDALPISYWRRWMRELPTVQSLAGARREKVLKLWEGLGYYTRANNLQRAARMIVDRHGGRFPEKYDDLVALPGDRKSTRLNSSHVSISYA